MLRALVVGNGQSRLKIKQVPTCTTVIGCNAAYKHFDCDEIVAVDKRMVDEVLTKTNITVWTRIDHVHELFNNTRIKVLPRVLGDQQQRMFNPINWGSGSYALLLAASHFENVSCIGFDFYSYDQYVNNVYKGSTNYAPATASAVDPAFWIEQVSLILDHFDSCSFTFYKDTLLPFPENLLVKKNLTLIDI